LDKVIKYALVHDLVEAYADDAFVFDEEQVKEKDSREHLALERLKGQKFSKGFAEVIEEYEKLDNEEIKFVYGLDKLMPAFTLVQGKVDIWKKYGVTISGWEEKFGPKIRKSKYLEPYLQQLIELQKQNPELLAV
jgi:5'-deoxynucleotidase YfbR-like HD superfamily hydrolase